MTRSRWLTAFWARNVASIIWFLAWLIAPRIAAGRNSPVAGRSCSARIRFISCCWSSVS